MGRTKRPTITDVSQAAGVSQTAVSQVLSGKGSFPESTRERVREVARQLGYRPSRAAASLRTGKTRTIGIVLAGSSEPLWRSQWVSVTARILVDVAEALHEQNYALLVIPHDGLEMISADLIDGVIISDSLPDDPGIDAAVAQDIPVVTNDRLSDPRIAVHVDSGYEEMSRIAWDLFSRRGAKTPALLTEPNLFVSDYSAERIWRELCHQHSIEPLVQRVAFDRRDLEEGVGALIDAGADAIYSFVGGGVTVANILRSRGKKLGSEILLLSAEIDEPEQTVSAGISTLAYHAQAGGAPAVELLLDTLEGRLAPPQKARLGYSVTEAASTLGSSSA
jgi:DNA-binding LacI/PurR family transcriptional regulator